ncbi:MAG: glycosyltransferase family 4 protein [Pikeienuella sp.]
MKPCLAYPGDLNTPTGGYVYDAAVINASEGAMVPLALPDGFPDPSGADLAAAQQALSRAGTAVIDGLAFGVMPVELIEALPRRPIALCHHPLGYEPGISTERSAMLVEAERTALSHAAHVVVTSDATARVLVSDFGLSADHISVAPPGLERFGVAPFWTAGKTTETPVILTVASLTYRKAHDVLVQALSKISDMNWRAQWVGPVDREPGRLQALQDMIADCGLSDRIEIAGACEINKLNEAYNKAALFCLPSRYEGYGMVFDEAMMRGLPIVACNAGAVGDVVPENAGLLCPIDDPTALAASLRNLLQNRELASAKATAAREHALTLPSWRDTYSVFAEVLRRVG